MTNLVTPQSQTALPKTSSVNARATRWDTRLSLESRSRQVSALKGTASLLGLDIIPLSTGRPSSALYPWDSVNFQRFGLLRSTEEKLVDKGTETHCKNMEKGFDLTAALNYGNAAGAPPLLEFVTEHIKMVHNPLYEDWTCCLTCGTTSAMEIVLRMFTQRGDNILAEEHTYAGMIEAATSIGIHIRGVKMDAQGLLPGSLDSILTAWDIARGPKPFLLYMIPSGHNPTGTTQSASRRRAIYEVAERHDLYIIEDDPYYFLQLEACKTTSEAFDKQNLNIKQHYLKQLPPSYLSLDKSGRVLRLDSASKSLAPGLRCGWMTSCCQIVERFLMHSELSTVAPSGVSQLMLYKLLVEEWGQEGFINWLVHLSQLYSVRRDILVRACEQYLPKDICRWEAPDVGMFLWVHLDCGMPSFRHGLDPAQVQAAILVAEGRIFSRAVKHGVLVSRGSWFRAGEADENGINFRLTFAAATIDQLEEGVKRLGEVLRSDYLN